MKEFIDWQIFLNVESKHDIDCYCEMCNSAYLQYLQEVKDGHTYKTPCKECEVIKN